MDRIERDRVNTQMREPTTQVNTNKKKITKKYETTTVELRND